MNAGFALLETGLCQAKNAVNILAKNFIVFAVSSIAFWIIGFGLMFGDGNGILGLGGWFLAGTDNSPATGEAYSGVFSALSWTGVPLAAKFFFQLVFAGTAATIVSGAVAERIKFFSFIMFSFILIALIYPVVGHWGWGGGWLSGLGFVDFAGSTMVHSVGGWAALLGAFILGPRVGKYRPDGSTKPIPGHNMSLATLGTLILWLGWFGFNPGSTMAADPAAISSIALNTNMAGAAGCLVAALISYLVLGKPDLSMILNGTLAGLVAVTAGCNSVSVAGSVFIGTIAGVLVVYAVLFFDRVRIDDPVGALSVHLVNGVFGTAAVGLFSIKGGLFYGGGFRLLGVQLLGIAAVGAFVVAASAIAWLALKATIGIRVTAEEERSGLDLGEHGMEAYPGFAQNSPEPSMMDIT
ncbi:MAG: ammonium transporter [Acidobacteria bacterium]|nr:MAG: ammonium transporter [Acidobacteriota bacterium]